MLEIIGLIYFTKKIGFLANSKGLKAGNWKAYTVLFWFLAEFAGFFLGILIFQDQVAGILFAYACAIGSFFAVRAVLAKKPDVLMDEEINQIGQPVEA
jgi:hypothetical protein